ncbi:hypothetical protein KAU86_02590 [bacterium]|nr:hypothetical protein [bacterium]
MAVIIRETRILGGKSVAGTKVYKSDRFVTKEMAHEADRLDIFLKDKMNEIRKKLHDMGLLDQNKKKREYILKLRYELGKRLSFVDDPKVLHPDDKKYIWRALFDHAQDLAPGTPDERANNRPKTSFFAYCYKLAKVPWDIVESGGDWSSWQRFFDLAIKRDERIFVWLGKQSDKLRSSFKKNWLKETTKSLTDQFHNRDTTVLSEAELEQELTNILEKINA